MKLKIFVLTLSILTFTACSIPVDAAPPPTALMPATPQPTLIAPATFTPIPALTQVATSTPTVFAPVADLPFCDDPRGRELLTSFCAVIASKDGPLLASLVPHLTAWTCATIAMATWLITMWNMQNLFLKPPSRPTWGISFGSGESTLGSFQEIILPALQQVFIPGAIIECNQIKLGGVTYQALWPYADLNYYSVHFPGTEVNGRLDWQTWAVGMDNLAGRPYIAALIHYEWEP
ncbi:MAG: hypothetical protein IPL71_11190 [Anaerolineales bacterium]|uniref:hypothetical protein n=1 Tax=Candidatus Villigracilis proximus TaxID=3140683 RepID=UPI003134F9C7|nr:hypothetical protein [Anaerolineales bacterium]